MTDEAMSPLRRRMIEDMTIRKLAPKTQHDYVRKGSRTSLRSSADRPTRRASRTCAAFSCIWRRAARGMPTLNHTVSTLRFFFRVTLEALRHRRAHPRSSTSRASCRSFSSPEEVARLLDAAPGLKYKAALSVAYGAGLRAAEVISLKVCDIDSKRMVIRVEQGKGRKDRYVMLSPHLLELLRAWWKAARPQGWLFPGRDPVQPMTTRQLNRACHAAAQMAEIDKRVSLAHLAAQLRHPSAGAEHRYQRDPGPARSRQARHHGALHPRRHQDDPRGHEPAGAHRASSSRRSEPPA